MTIKRDLCLLFNLDPDDCDYVSLTFTVDAGGEHSRVTCAVVDDETYGLTGIREIKELPA
jgi:hypothetical protein